MNIITRMLIYDATYLLGFLFMLVLCTVRSRAYGISRLRAFIYCFITFGGGLCGAWLVGQVYNLIASLKDWYPKIKVDMLGAVIFTTVFLLAAVYPEKWFLKLWQKKKEKADAEADGDQKKKRAAPKTVSFRDTMDLMIPGAFVVFATIKIGCAINGCCMGVEWSWGLMNPQLNKTLFPVQIFESASLFAIVIVSYYIKQSRFYRRGMAGPLAAFMYGAVRFFWEHFRWYSPETRYFVFGLTLWQAFCVVVLIVAGIWVWVLYKTQPNEPLPKGRSYAFLEKVFTSKEKQRKKELAQNRVHHKKKKKGGKKR
ncbi:MAG: prolipoprotein diacylglyceryl transferase [Clostridia bacterium]|nr:prolipoprotein diacylglyceryl transferase [Clostridia bacterium]